LIKLEFKMICISQWSFSLTIVWKSVPVMNFNCPSKISQLHSEILINISPFCKLKTFTWHIIIIIDTLVLVIIVQQKRISVDRLHIVEHL
jgi:AAA+ ATPase superfamily predicted ATPase